MKMTISVGKCLKSKVVKEHINKNFGTCKILCNLRELYTAFKEKQPNVNIGFSKFYALGPKWCVLAGSKMIHFVCVCKTLQPPIFGTEICEFWNTVYTLYFYMDEFKNGKASITTVTSQMNYNSVKYCYHILHGTLDCLTVYNTWIYLTSSRNI